ncbi:MAG: diacylglycerol kinase [Gammaproteobacteria bacterium]|nr:diacylglycerol kinase [Gammaproteobacteria bacterium]MDH3534338.1 diacylglycerol kinase [Gammaproteobacteria bacterium]
MAFSGNRGLGRIMKATAYSWQGLRAAYHHEEAFRQEVWLCIVMFPLGLYLGDGGVEKALLAGSVLLLPLVEILNSALEAVVDRFGDEMHELSGRAKDMGSAAVALAILLTSVIWLLVLFF